MAFLILAFHVSSMAVVGCALAGIAVIGLGVIQLLPELFEEKFGERTILNTHTHTYARARTHPRADSREHCSLQRARVCVVAD